MCCTRLVCANRSRARPIFAVNANCAPAAGLKSPLFCAAERRFHDAPSDNLLFFPFQLFCSLFGHFCTAADLSARATAPLFIGSRLTCACLRVLYGLTCARAEQSAKIKSRKVLELIAILSESLVDGRCQCPAAPLPMPHALLTQILWLLLIN